MTTSLRFLAIGVFSCLLLASCAAQRGMPDGSLVKLDVSYVSADMTTVGYLVRPLKPGKLPAVVLLHASRGLDADTRTQAERLAQQGYVTLAVDLYGGKTAATAEEAQKLVAQVQKDSEKALANLKAATEYVKASPSADPERLEFMNAGDDDSSEAGKAWADVVQSLMEKL